MAARATKLDCAGLALIGNAFGYSDPLLSHGVDYAIEGAQRLAQCLQAEDLEVAVSRYHKAARRLLWLDVGLHRIAYEVLWREALYKRLLPDGALVSGVRLGEKVNQLSWLLAGL
jgi:flavin-dependent dehydrogenase